MSSLYSYYAMIELPIVLFMAFLMSVSAGNFYKDVDIIWGDQRAKILNGGEDLTLSLDKFSGSGFQSKNEFLFGRFDMQLKLVSGNSAGTVTTFYLSSQGDQHDEIDFEFLGNVSGEPYTVHTNVYSKGNGKKEQQFHLWFDPSTSFHTYSIVWNTQNIIFMVDGIPLRVFTNNEAIGVPYPNSQGMRVYCSLWNADDWATQGGRVKTDWTKAPFIASFRNFTANGCVSNQSSRTSCASKAANSLIKDHAWQNQTLDAGGRSRLQWVQKKYMVYNYCTDVQRYSKQGLPPECERPRF